MEKEAPWDNPVPLVPPLLRTVNVPPPNILGRTSALIIFMCFLCPRGLWNFAVVYIFFYASPSYVDICTYLPGLGSPRVLCIYCILDFRWPSASLISI